MRAKPTRGRGRLLTFAAALARASLVASALVACLILASAAVPGITGYKTMIVTGGSMEPVISAGDAVLLRPASPNQIHSGDVITFHPLSGPHTMTTHRVVASMSVAGRPHFQTQGDANRTPDPDLAPAENIIGRVALRIPLLGYLLYYAATATGRLVLVALPGALVAIWHARAMRKQPRPHRDLDWDTAVLDILPARPGERSHATVRLALISPIALVAVLLTATILGQSTALYTNAVGVGSNSLTTTTLEPPSSLAATPACDGTNSAKATLTWTATTSTFADGYEILRSTTTGGPYTSVAQVTGRTTTTYTNTGLATGSTYYFVARATASNWTSVNSNEVSATTPDPCP